MKVRWVPGVVVAAWSMLAGRDAGCTNRDFIDETIVSRRMPSRELGIELGAESRLDADYRLQGWYTPEIEFAATARWFLEARVQGVDRGTGLELGGWSAGTRWQLLSDAHWPVDVSAAIEYEVETGAAKHPQVERLLAPRAALTRRLGAGLLLTANVGAAHRLVPAPATRFAWGFGMRYPEGAVLEAGLEVDREPLERSTRIVPQAWIRLPGEARLRLGGVFGLDPRPYRFVARAVLETEFF